MSTPTSAGSVTVVAPGTVPWRSGADVMGTMEPAFARNIGAEPEAALALLAGYHARTLWLDSVTSRRIDLVRTDPGYRDLCEAFHDSVEECLVLDGEVLLSAEGELAAGDYFWRPPGWVHAAQSRHGFVALLMMEGEQPAEDSRRVTRVVRENHDAGRHAGDGDPLGPRGYVRRMETRLLPWRPGEGELFGLGAHDGAGTKVLSENVLTGTSTALAQLPDRWSGAGSALALERFVVNTAGTLVVDDVSMPEPSLVHVPAGVGPPRLVADGPVTIMVKTAVPT